MKKTAVEWVFQELRGTDDKGDFIFQGVINSELIEQAKEMEKQQIIDAYIDGYSAESWNADSQKYYNEKFQNKKNYN